MLFLPYRFKVHGRRTNIGFNVAPSAEEAKQKVSAFHHQCGFRVGNVGAKVHKWMNSMRGGTSYKHPVHTVEWEEVKMAPAFAFLTSALSLPGRVDSWEVCI